MQQSSNSLLHFTNKLDVIIAILNDKFYGSYCLERFQYQDLSYELPVPKVSFCDIPEETIIQYTHYGKYCIGLSKEWGKRKHLNPVLNIEKHSAIAESFVKGYKGTDVGIGLVNISVSELRYLFDNTKSNNNLEEQERSLMYDKIGIALDQIEKLGKVVTIV